MSARRSRYGASRVAMPPPKISNHASNGEGHSASPPRPAAEVAERPGRPRAHRAPPRDPPPRRSRGRRLQATRRPLSEHARALRSRPAGREANRVALVGPAQAFIMMAASAPSGSSARRGRGSRPRWADSRDVSVRWLEAEDAVHEAGMRMDPPPSVPTARPRARPPPPPRRRRSTRRACDQVPRVAGDPEEQVMRGPDPPDGRGVGLAELDRARGLETRHDRRVLGGDIVGVEWCPKVVLMPRVSPGPWSRRALRGATLAPCSLLPEGPLGRPGLLHGLVGGERHEGVELRVQALDPRRAPPR